ncbi:MAG: hypothetical protein HY000_05170 [Planctomycetes bacterium]|nr:hypothetical protein [Planctomycetota bacterium]
MDSPKDIRDPLIRSVLKDFRSRFAPHSEILWVRERDGERIDISRAHLLRYGIESLRHADLPDVGMLNLDRHWLFLVDARNFRSPERCEVLKELFSSSPFALVIITAFRSRLDIQDSISEPVWGTAAWFSSEPDHLIHFDSSRLIGPRRCGSSAPTLV